MIDQFSVENDFPDIEAIAAIAAMSESFSIGVIAKKLPNLIGGLERYCPVKTAATFGGLLTQKRLQSNCLRLEVLIHLCVGFCGGVRAPTQNIINQGFSSVGSVCGYMEDPREDVFVGNIYSKRGNYRILEGIWEGATFYLQRIINMVDSLPNNDRFKIISESIHALLKLSEMVCERAKLQRNEIGPNVRNNNLPQSLILNSEKYRALVRFSSDDLAVLGVSLDNLGSFIFEQGSRGLLADQAISDTDLEAAPLVLQEGMVYLVLPTAISVAIRRYFIKMLGVGDNRDIFVRALGYEYAELFSTAQFFGETGPFLPFAHDFCGSRCALSQEVDVGRYLNIFFFLDDLVSYEDGGFGGAFHGSETLKADACKAIEIMQMDCERREGFKDGMTLIVGCGVGRGFILEGFHQPKSRWDSKFLSAYDLISLASMDGIRVLDLWRVRRMEFILQQNGVIFQNMNGLLNLFAWAESLDGHLVPHGEIPNDFLGEGVRLLLPITQNGLGDLRQKLFSTADEHVEKFVDGTWKVVRTHGRSHFDEDAKRPTYVCLDRGGNKILLGANITKVRCWWFEAVAKDGVLSDLSYNRWEMMGVWIARVADIIDKKFGKDIGEGPVYWRCIFEGGLDSIEVDRFGEHEDLINQFNLNLNLDRRIIELRVGPGFDRALYHPHNIAEVEFVRAFLRGLSELFCINYDAILASVEFTWFDVHARHNHVFFQSGYRDYFGEVLSMRPITIGKFDDAFIKLGLGWRVRKPIDGNCINGKRECTIFLQKLVDQLIDDLVDHLRIFERKALLHKLLTNYEAASHSRDRWHRTSAAILALREDKAAAMEGMSKHEFELNATFQATRNLIEMVLCESPLYNGDVPGELDMALMLTQSAQIFHLSGWLGLIHWDLLEPELIIRPLGDIHAHHDFMEEVIEPFGKASSEYRYQSSVKRYPKILRGVSVQKKSIDGGVSAEFLEAWEKDFGVSLDSYRSFIDALENYGVESRQMIFNVSRSQLIALCDNFDAGMTIVNSLALHARPAWRVPPEGYSWKDIAPARFKRRLGLLRRPIIQLEGGDDPIFIINPALVREGFISIFRNYYYGEYADEHLGPAMRKYAGAARKRDGEDFNERVASRMEELGWKVEREVKITKALEKGFDRDYGDIDVLAWDSRSGRVLIMECKDLQFKKTYGEIAEQLSDYRGLVSADGRKRDSLRKHLDRMDVVSAHLGRLAKFLKLGLLDSVEGHLIFSHPVPMMFSKNLGENSVVINTFDSLEGI